MRHPSTLALVLPLLTLCASAQGLERCGLGKDFHAGRRKALAAELKTGVLVLRGLPASRAYTRFSQDKTFWYYTGVESADAALVVDLASGREILFLPPRAAMLEGWDGELWDVRDAWVPELTGIAEIRATPKLDSTLAELIPAADNLVWTSLAPHITLTSATDRAVQYDRTVEADAFDGRSSREAAFAASLRSRFGAEVKDITFPTNKLRRIKTAEELAAMQQAATAGALAMAEAMRSTRQGLLESDLEAVLDLVQRRNGAAGPAYQAIVGSGTNSLILHYMHNRRRLVDGDILLIDYAPELDHYTCDITRTWPVNGKFSARQAELYDAVLAAQEAGIAEARPGRGIADVERACSNTLKELGFSHLTRHGACHLIGMEVHDPGMIRGALVPGVAFTIEPGLYEAETGIGIRIEDVVVITESGCDVISRAVPKRRDAIEALIAQRGVLDWLDEAGK